MLNIFDCSNWIRIQYEVDKSGLALRNIYNQALYSKESTNIYVFDGRNAKAARRSIFPGYKVGRQPAGDEFYKTLDISKKILACSPQLLVEVEGFEADDVIASIVRSAPGVKIKIWSNDGDFRTLCNADVQMSDPSLKEVDASEVRLFKTLVGDPSDKIPGFNGFGKGSFEKLSKVQKECWMVALEGGGVIGVDPERFGLTIKQMPWLILHIEDLRGYWKVVNFLDVPDELMERGTVVGKKNVELANKYLKEILQ